MLTASDNFVGNGSCTHAANAVMRYTPTLQDLQLKRIHIRTPFFTPRKCMLAFAVGLIAAAIVIRLTLTLSRAYSDLHLASDTDGELVILPEHEAKQGNAYCLDGSAPGFYFRKGSSKSRHKWLIALPHSSWCWSAEECHRWMGITALGSTRDISTTRAFSGILSASSVTNPQFRDWNVALIVSCDGSSFLGNRSAALQYMGVDLQLRGSAILTTILDHLASTMGLSDARDVILYGQSSSAVAAVLHADYLQSLLVKGAAGSVFTVVDGGVSLSYASTAVNDSRFEKFTALHGIRNSVHIRSCVSRANPERCIFIDHLLPYVGRPALLLSSLYDSWSLRLLGPLLIPEVCGPEDHPLRTPCTQAAAFDPAQLPLYLDYARRLKKFVQSLSLNLRAAYITVCPSSLLSSNSSFATRHPLVTDGTVANVVAEWLVGAGRRGSIVIEEIDASKTVSQLAACL